MSPSVKLVQSFFFFFYLVLINWLTSAHNRCPLMDWKSGAAITDLGFISSNKNFTPTPHPHPPPPLMDQRVLLDWLDSVPASACAVRFRKSDLAPCYLLKTSNVHGLNTRPKLRSSKLHCAGLWLSSGKSDSRFAWWSRATPLAHKWKPIFFWISFPIFTCILLHQQNSKKKKKKAEALFINTACMPPMPFHFKMNMHVILGMHTWKKDEALWQQTTIPRRAVWYNMTGLLNVGGKPVKH